MTAKIDAKASPPYQRRYLVSRMGDAGTFQENLRVFRIYRYMTFHVIGGPAIAAEFVGRAPIDEHGFLRLEMLDEGMIVVKPGLLYRKVPMTGEIMNQHLRAMATWKKPDPQIFYEIDKNAPPIDVGKVDFTGVTKQ